MHVKTCLSIFFLNFIFATSWGQAQNTNVIIEPLNKPVFVNTGNPEEDAKRYEEAKNQWIQANQREYQQLSTGNTNPSGSDMEVVAKNAQSIDDLPGFPVRINTGNREQDELNYKVAKEKWYASNKELIELFYQENAKRNNTLTKPTE